MDRGGRGRGGLRNYRLPIYHLPSVYEAITIYHLPFTDLHTPQGLYIPLRVYIPGDYRLVNPRRNLLFRVSIDDSSTVETPAETWVHPTIRDEEGKRVTNGREDLGIGGLTGGKWGVRGWRSGRGNSAGGGGYGRELGGTPGGYAGRCYESVNNSGGLQRKW
jgi:hypothetical protein